jgi:cation:H+ antiporter
MLIILTWFLVFVISMAALIVASDYFTDAAEKLGVLIGLPPFIIGVTIVSIGTSLPELLSSILAVLEGSPGIVIGNVVGSNIANIFLILGTASVISRQLSINYDLTSVDLPLFVGSAFLLALMVSDGDFTRGEAVLALLGFGVYLFYTFNTSHETPEIEEVKQDRATTIRQAIILVVSAAFIYLGANYTIKSVIQLSEILEIGEEIVAITALALGTSLPELMVTFNLAKKGNPEIAVGNVLGSNIFNSLMVMGVPGLMQTLNVPDSILNHGIPVMLVATILFFFVTQDKKVTKWEGWLFFIFYAWFIGKVFGGF